MSLPRTPQSVMDRLYQQLALVHHLCEREHIRYWLIGGSLLGQVRHGTIIPWDDDVDIGIDERDVTRLKQALDATVGALDLTIQHSEHGLKMSCKLRKGVGLDVFLYKLANSPVMNDSNPRKWELAKEISRKCWPRDWFLASELDSLKLVPFGPLRETWVPNLAMRYLYSVYGDDCMEYARLDFSHLENRKHSTHNIPIRIGGPSPPRTPRGNIPGAEPPYYIATITTIQPETIPSFYASSKLQK